MSRRWSLGVYRRLLRCYPRSFRDEYGADMVLLFAHQLGDEPALRVWGRGIVDLAVTVPNQHLEAHMNRPSTHLLPVVFGAFAAAGVLAAVLAGSSTALAGAALAVAAVAGALSILASRRSRPLAVTGAARALWWKLVLIGALALVAMIAAEGATDLSLWLPMVITIGAALLLIVAGVVLGVAQLFVPLRRTAR